MADRYFRDTPHEELSEYVKECVSDLMEQHNKFSTMAVIERLFYLNGEVLPPAEERDQSNGPYHSFYNRVYAIIRHGYEAGEYRRIKRGVYKVAPKEKPELKIGTVTQQLQWEREQQEAEKSATEQSAPEAVEPDNSIAFGDLVLDIVVSNERVHVAKGNDGHLYKVEFERL